MTENKKLAKKEIEVNVSIRMFEKVQQETLNKVRNNLAEATTYLNVTNNNIKNILNLSEKVKLHKSYLHQDEYDIVIRGYARMLASTQACRNELLKIIAQLEYQDESAL